MEFSGGQILTYSYTWIVFTQERTAVPKNRDVSFRSSRGVHSVRSAGGRIFRFRRTTPRVPTPSDPRERASRSDVTGQKTCSPNTECIHNTAEGKRPGFGVRVRRAIAAGRCRARPISRRRARFTDVRERNGSFPEEASRSTETTLP